MKTKTIELRQFKECSEELKEKILQRYWDINVDHDWWTGVYEQFKDKHTDWQIDEMYFSYSYSQGDGAMFEGKLLKIPDCINIRPIVRKLIDAGKVDIYLRTKHSGRYYHEKSYSNAYEIEWYSKSLSNCENIEEYMYSLESAICSYFESCCKELFSMIIEEHKYRTKKEAIKETLIENEYYFNESGEIDTP